ncbi:unnamed protein product, partial [Phaeothamnion confervicola]
NGSPVTSLSYDTMEELLWVGFEDGRIVSYLQPEMQAFTAVKAHP